MTVCASMYMKEMDDIVDLVKKNTNHLFVNQYVLPPPISTTALHLLYLMLTHAGITDEKKKQFCLSIMLMQTGLETHESVTINKNNTNQQSLTRQLSVLAGDYYSSRYYNILAQMGEIGLIQQLSIGISKINEAKMNMYLQKNDQTSYTEDLFQQIEIICTELYVRFSRWLGLHISNKWTGILRRILLAEKLIDMIQQNERKNADYELLSRFHHKANYLLTISRNDIKKWMEEAHYHEILQIIDRLLEANYTKSFVKEM